ncbi:MAG: pantoate kinase [Nanoarchaeota archaeon]
MAKAFAPGNLSCIFRICHSSTPAKMHSLGVGLTTNKGVIVETKRNNKTVIFFNGKKINFPTVLTAINMLTKEQFIVDIISELPLGCGFGLSGACTLASVYSINALLILNKQEYELAMISHIAEVKNSTGLGDIAGQFNGGFLMKTMSGEPLEVERLNIKDKYIYYKVFGELYTKDILKNKSLTDKINHAGDIALNKIRLLINPNLIDIIKISKEFAEKSGLLKSPEVINEIKKIESLGGYASMIMLGNAVYSNIEFPDCERAEISNKRACLLNN